LGVKLQLPVEDFIYDIRWEEDETEWRARARRELVLSLLDRYRFKRENQTILDVGCGTGMLVQQLQPYGKVYGMDFSPRAVAYSRQRQLSCTLVGTADSVCFTPDTFDIVTMVEVLEHIEDDMQALHDIRKLMRPGGVLVLTVPAFSFLWSRRDVHLHHKRRYTKKELNEKLTETGFRPLYISYIDLFLFLPLLLLVRLNRLAREPDRLQVYEVSAPTLINELLLRICRVERYLYTRMQFPFGVSIACVAERIPNGH
jgi:SAM-dependent methyltransferase